MELLSCAVAHVAAQPHATIVQNVSRPPVAPRDIEAWEKENSPYTLPADLKALYGFSDGLLVRWQVKYGAEPCPIGCIHLPAVAQIKRVSLGATVHFAPRLPYSPLFAAPHSQSPPPPTSSPSSSSSSAHHQLQNLSAAATQTAFQRAFLHTTSAAPLTSLLDIVPAAATGGKGVPGEGEAFSGARVAAEMSVDDGDEEDTTLQRQPLVPSSAGAAAALSRVCAFDIDPMCTDGRMLLVFFPSSVVACDSHPSVYFQDLSCRLHFVAGSFAEYHALLLAHLGIVHWQYAFTHVGLPAAAQTWLRIFAPERLYLDLQYARLLRSFLRSFAAVTASAASSLSLPPTAEAAMLPAFPHLSSVRAATCGTAPAAAAALPLLALVVRGAQAPGATTAVASLSPTAGGGTAARRRNIMATTNAPTPAATATSSVSPARPHTVADWTPGTGAGSRAKPLDASQLGATSSAMRTNSAMGTVGGGATLSRTTAAAANASATSTAGAAVKNGGGGEHDPQVIDKSLSLLNFSLNAIDALVATKATLVKPIVATAPSSTHISDAASVATASAAAAATLPPSDAPLVDAPAPAPLPVAAATAPPATAARSTSSSAVHSSDASAPPQVAGAAPPPAPRLHAFRQSSIAAPATQPAPPPPPQQALAGSAWSIAPGAVAAAAAQRALHSGAGSNAAATVALLASVVGTAATMSTSEAPARASAPPVATRRLSIAERAAATTERIAAATAAAVAAATQRPSSGARRAAFGL